MADVDPEREGQPPEKLKPPIWRLSDVVLGLLGALFFSVLGSLLLILLFDVDPLTLADGQGPGTIEFSLATLVVNVIAFATPLWVISRWRRVNWWEAGWRPMSRGWWLTAFLAGLGGLFLVNLIANLLVWLFELPPENPQINFVMPEGFSLGGLVGMTLLVGILVPIVEEWLFRGLLYRWLRQRSGFLWSALLSSLIFGLFHGSPVILIVGTAVLGFLCAWVYEQSGSLWGAIMVHGVNNGIIIVLLYLSSF